MSPAATVRFPIEVGHIMVFARSIADPNPIYYDEEYARTTEVGSLIAPPTFLRASVQFQSEYRQRPVIGQPWRGSGREPTGLPAGSHDGGGTGLLAEQHFEYHGLVRAGDVLSAEERAGETWEKHGQRAGRLVFTETITEYRNQRGERVATARSVSVRTERAVSGQDA